MTIFNEKEYLIGTAEYGANFWNAMRGIPHAYDKIHGGANGITGGYALPSGSNEKLQKAITQESLFRSMATVIKAYGGASRIFCQGLLRHCRVGAGGRQHSASGWCE